MLTMWVHDVIASAATLKLLELLPQPLDGFHDCPGVPPSPPPSLARLLSIDAELAVTIVILRACQRVQLLLD